MLFGAHILHVYGLRGGNWSALFLTAGSRPQPALAKQEGTFIFGNSLGYDSQFYHWIAHDPLLKRGLKSNVDTPQLRWRRILVPGLAWTTALGRDSWIDAALLGQQYAWAFLGGYWLGIWFVLVPAVVTSFDRLTVDLAFAALCCGLVFYHQRKRIGPVAAVLALAALTRETGFLLIGAAVFYAVRQRRWRDAAVAAAAGIPAFVWYLWLRDQPGAPDWQITATLSILPSYAGVSRLPALLARTLDVVSLAGLLIGIYLALRGVRSAAATLADHAAAIFAVFLIAFSVTVPWFEPFGYVRVGSPLFLFLAMRGGAGDLPLLLVLPRIALQAAAPLWRAARLF